MRTNRFTFLLGLPLFFLFSCKEPSASPIILAENSSTLIFSPQWRTSVAYGEAETMYIFESKDRGFVDLDDLKRDSRLLRKVKRKDLEQCLSLLRHSIRRKGASSKDMRPAYQLVLTGKDDFRLAYWEIRATSENGDPNLADFVAIFPTGGVFQVKEFKEFLSFANEESTAQ